MWANMSTIGFCIEHIISLLNEAVNRITARCSYLRGQVSVALILGTGVLFRLQMDMDVLILHVEDLDYITEKVSWRYLLYQTLLRPSHNPCYQIVSACITTQKHNAGQTSCHDMETPFASWAICGGNPLVTGGFIAQRSSNTELCSFFVDSPKKRLNELSVDISVIWYASTFILRHHGHAVLWCMT